jgi:acetyltransferase-like isoleucine patch superfamily enzyme
MLQLLRLALAIYWLRAVYMPFWTIWARLSLWSWGGRVGRRLKVSGRLRLYIGGRLSIGNDVVMASGPANFVGGDRRMTFRVGRDAELSIGDGCGLSNSTLVAVNRIVIHEQTLIGGGCDIYDNDFHPVVLEDRLQWKRPRSAPIEIGPRAFVGSHTIILKGVTIGEGAVIGAGSVVTRDVPPFEVWGGRPARFIAVAPRRTEGNGQRDVHAAGEAHA